MEREKSLIDQWVCLTEERNAVLVPAAGSGIPGAPADWTPPNGMETHVPVIFLDLNGEWAGWERGWWGVGVKDGARAGRAGWGDVRAGRVG